MPDRAGWKNPTRYLLLNQQEGQFLEDLLLWYGRLAHDIGRGRDLETCNHLLKAVVRMNGGGSNHEGMAEERIRRQRPRSPDDMGGPPRRRNRVAGPEI